LSETVIILGSKGAGLVLRSKTGKGGLILALPNYGGTTIPELNEAFRENSPKCVVLGNIGKIKLDIYLKK
jgi:hypothetical protein